MRKFHGSNGPCGASAGCRLRLRGTRLRRSEWRFRAGPALPNRESDKPAAVSSRARCQNFRRVGHAALAEADLAIGSDDIDGALHDQPIGVIERRNLLAFIHQQWKLEV